MKKREKVTLYLCGIAWGCEVGNTSVHLYDSIEELKEQSCWKKDGIVKLTVEAEFLEEPIIAGDKHGRTTSNRRRAR